MLEPQNGQPILSWRDELLTMEFSEADAEVLIRILKDKIRSYTHTEDGPAYNMNYGYMARAARMCYEVSVDRILPALSKEDIWVLICLPRVTETEFIHGTIGNLKKSVRESGVDDISDGHRMAKEVHTIMTC
jgi:hypothetical protein